MKAFKIILKYAILWVLYGTIYYLLETAWRTDHTSHWSMFILGGICGLIVGGLNEFFTWKMPLWKQCLIGALVITGLEFVTGCIVNIWLGWDVWYYDSFDIMHQICLPFTLLWFLLSGVAIVVDDWLRYFLFKEDKPHYKLF